MLKNLRAPRSAVMQHHFPHFPASPARPSGSALGIAARRGASCALVLVALAGTLGVTPDRADAAARRTVRTVIRTTTTLARTTSTVIPATVPVTPFPSAGAPDAAPITTSLITLGGPATTVSTTPRTDPPGFVPLTPAATGSASVRTDPPGLVPLGQVRVAPALAPEPAVVPVAAATTTTTRPPKATRSSRTKRATTAATTTVPVVPLTGAAAATPSTRIALVAAAAAPTTPSTATSTAPAATGAALTISPVLGPAGGQSRTLAAAAPSTTGVVGAGDASVTTTTAPVYVFAQPTEPPPPVHPMVSTVIETARAMLGLPYIWAAEGPDGYDCSGLTMVAWRMAGISLIHNSAAQFNQTARVALADIQPGDLVFFGNPIHHEGLYIGDGKMIEAAKQGVPVRISSINRSDLVGIGRPRW